MSQKDKGKREPGANKALINNALKSWDLPKIDIKDPVAVRQRIGEYLQHCAENDCVPSPPGCANWLGVHPDTVLSWYKGERSTPEHQRVMSEFYGLLQEIWAQEMHDGSIPGINGIFMSKVYFGYKDTQDIVVQHTANDQLSVADLIAESKRLPGAETLALPEGTQTLDAIDVETRVLDYDPRYEKSLARRKRMEERHAAVVANRPRKKAEKNARDRAYYRAHKAEQLERNARAKARKAAEKAAEKVQNAAPDDK